MGIFFLGDQGWTIRIVSNVWNDAQKLVDLESTEFDYALLVLRMDLNFLGTLITQPGLWIWAMNLKFTWLKSIYPNEVLGIMSMIIVSYLKILLLHGSGENLSTSWTLIGNNIIFFKNIVHFYMDKICTGNNFGCILRSIFLICNYVMIIDVDSIAFWISVLKFKVYITKHCRINIFCMGLFWYLIWNWCPFE